MKKLLLSIWALLLLVGCTSTKQDDQNLLTTYQDNLEDYEIFEICFIGVRNNERSIQDLIDRISKQKGYEFIADFKDEDIYEGDLGLYNDNVYVIIPNDDVSVTVGRYSWYAGGITEIWHKTEDGKPFIYVESADSSNPVSMIEFVKNADAGQMMTGFNNAYRRLRTDFLMGVVDITPYDKFSTDEIPSIDEVIDDILYNQLKVGEAIEHGATLSTMGEQTWEGDYYVIKYLHTEEHNPLMCYGIHYDRLSGKAKIIGSYDFMDWTYIQQ